MVFSPSTSSFLLRMENTLILSFSSRLKKLSLQMRAFSYLVGNSSFSGTFVSLLDASADLRDLRKVHACILSNGLGNDIYLGSKLLNHYAMHGSLHDSRKIFHRLVNRNPKLWNSVMAGYYREGHFDEILRLFSDMNRWGIRFGSSILTICLKSSIALKMIEKGREIHANSIKISLNLDGFVGSSLISLYTCIGAIGDAWQAFTEILFKDMVAYSTMLTAYAQISGPGSQKAFDIARYMLQEEFTLNRVTLISLLQVVGQTEAGKEGRSLHCYAVRRGIDLSDEVLKTSLMGMYIKCGELATGKSIFNKMEGSTASCNVLIAGLIRSGHLYEALRYFSTMTFEANTLPDSITLATLLSACSELMSFHLAASIHCYILRNGVLFDLVLSTTLIDAYFSCNEINKARNLFDKLAERDIITYNVTISGYLQNDLVNEAHKLTYEMLLKNIQPNSATLVCLLSSCAHPALIKMGQSIHGYMLRHFLESNLEISNQLLHMYAECGYSGISREIFVRMRKKDLVSWTSMMMACANHGFADETISLFSLMQDAGEKPDMVTIISLLQAFSLLGRLKEIKEIHGFIYRNQLIRDTTVLNSSIMAYSRCGKLDIAKVVFNNMLEKKLVSWNTMIASYGMHGLCAEAIEIFCHMQKENVRPDSITFTSLLSACSHAGFVQEGWRIFHLMIAEYMLSPHEEHYACIVDMLARSGYLQEAYEIIKQHPFRNSYGALSALLSACRTHGNTELGDVIGRKLLQLAPDTSGSYALMSNICVDSGRWANAAKLRVMAKETGLRKMPGHSTL